MAKVFGLQGYLTGKLGATVFAIRNGEQIGRQYNPVVSNPKTEGQVANRAKLKLLSQLSAAVQPVIAIPREGMASPRNLFTRVNYEYTSYGNNEATIPMADILLTKSYSGFPGFTADRASGNAVHVQLLEPAQPAWDKVVYVILRKGDTGAILPVASLVNSEAGSNGLFPADLPYFDGDISVHAYGIRLNTTESRLAFGNLIAPSAEEVAKIVTRRTYNQSDMSLSETRGLFLDSAVAQGQTAGVSYVTIEGIAYDRTTGAQNVGGTITGAGRLTLNDEFTMTAVAAQGYAFLGWAMTPDGNIVDTNATITGTADASKTYYAIFRYNAVVLTTSAYNRTTGQVINDAVITGGGTVELDSVANLTAPTIEGLEFQGWAYNKTGSIVSTANPYAVTASQNRTFVAIYAVPVETVQVRPLLANGMTAAMGSVSGGGTVEKGKNVTVTARAASGYDFDGWYSTAQATGTRVSGSTSYAFAATQNTELYAKFKVHQDEEDYN